MAYRNGYEVGRHSHSNLLLNKFFVFREDFEERGSLQGTSAYNSDTYLTQADRDRIGSERAAETYNEQRGVNVPKGTPCN